MLEIGLLPGATSRIRCPGGVCFHLVRRENMPLYRVVVNHEEQYSIWPADRELPLGWRADGFAGSKEECFDYIETVWTDMRPLSVRRTSSAG
jgi:MbtH protein